MTLDLATLTNQLAKLLPNGDGWPKAAGTNLYTTLTLLTPSIKRLFDFADYCQGDLFPATTVESLPDWQASCLLPDPAFPGALTTNQQRAQMLSRVTDLGGQSLNHYIGHATALGYGISISELAVPRAGEARAGQSATNAAGADNVWCVHVANATVTPFRCGNRAGDRLSTATDISLLQYELNRIKPATSWIEWFTT